MSKKQGMKRALELSIYNNGRPDFDKAKSLFEELSKRNIDAYYYLGELAQYQLRGQKSNKCLYYYQAGAKLGSLKCRYALAREYYLGNIVEKNEEKGRLEMLDCLTYLKSHMFEGEDMECNYLVAEALYMGIYSNIDLEGAKELLEPLSRHNHRKANYLLGMIYLQNKKTVKHGLDLLQKASYQGYDEATFILGKRAYDEGKYKEAYKHLSKIYENDYEASAMLGFIYLYGKDKPVDYDKAYYFISNAYKLGKQEIDYALGLCYYKIKERYQDNKEKYLYIFKLAVKHLSLAANRNNVEAQYLLARIMLTNGAEKNDEYALSLFESAYKNGKKEAASYLANMYFEGIGTEKDLRKALFYYEIDAYLGNPEAALKCARLYNQGFGNNSLDKAFDYYNQIKDKYPQEAYYALGVISKKRGDLKSAHKYFKKAVDNKSKEANYELALTYKNGLGTDVDNKSAFVYFSHASIFGEPKAIFEVARSFDEGIGTNVDKVKALQYYTAVENEFPICYYYIGMIWFNGVGVEKSLEKAFKNFEKGVEYSEPNCLNKLGDLYYNGLIVERDFVKAIRFYDQAKDSKHKDAIYSLGYMHYYGIGFKVNKPKGIDLFKLAYKLGSYDALYELAIIELENENKKEAIKMLKEASKKGVVKATRELGLLKKSHSNKYFKEAAQKGDGISIYHIALSLGKTKKAMELFQKSFELGINEAGYNAGIIAYKLRNYGLAIQYLSNQASESHYQAYFALADIYKNGRTVPKDLDRARFYYEIGSTLKSEARR